MWEEHANSQITSCNYSTRSFNIQNNSRPHHATCVRCPPPPFPVLVVVPVPVKKNSSMRRGDLFHPRTSEQSSPLHTLLRRPPHCDGRVFRPHPRKKTNLNDERDAALTCHQLQQLLRDASFSSPKPWPDSLEFVWPSLRERAQKQMQTIEVPPST